MSRKRPVSTVWSPTVMRRSVPPKSPPIWRSRPISRPNSMRLPPLARQRGLSFPPVALDDAASVLAGEADPGTTLVWTLTDGIAYFRGGAAPALARLNGLKTIGADDALFALCQDKFRSGAVLGALGLPVPQAGLARDGHWLVEPPASAAGWFVKPNRLGAKIGIWPDSRCQRSRPCAGAQPACLRRLSRRCRRPALCRRPQCARQFPRPDAGHRRRSARHRLCRFRRRFPDHGRQPGALRRHRRGRQGGRDSMPSRCWCRLPTPSRQPTQASAAIAERLMSGLGLRDVFSIDFRVEADDTVHLIEFEVCPGLPCFDFRAYCRQQWDLSSPMRWPRRRRAG